MDKIEINLKLLKFYVGSITASNLVRNTLVSKVITGFFESEANAEIYFTRRLKEVTPVEDGWGAHTVCMEVCEFTVEDNKLFYMIEPGHNLYLGGDHNLEENIIPSAQYIDTRSIQSLFQGMEGTS